MRRNWVIVFFLFATPICADWEPPDSVCTARNLNAIYFFDLSKGWSVGDEGTICNTTDGGMNWGCQQEGVYSYNLEDVFFATDLEGWAVGSSGKLLHTTHGGTTWAESTVTVYDLNAIHFVDTSFGVCVGVDGCFLRTMDGGESWSDTLIHTSSLYDVHFYNREIGWCTGIGVIGHTTDGGTTWDWSSPTPRPIYSISFSDSLRGWACGLSGVLCHTTDGKVWETSLISPYTLWGISFCDSLIGWTVGSSGTIKHTTNGGESWHDDPSGVYNTLKDIFFFNCDHGWLCGTEGTILIQPTGLEETRVIENLRGFHTFPNPFMDCSVFSLPHSGILRIFDSSGRLVREFAPAKQLTVIWDGRDSCGRLLPPGAYFFNFSYREGTISGKSIFLPRAR